MVTPSYVAKKVNGEYELVRGDAVGRTARLPWLLGGGLIITYALRRTGLLSLLAIGAGVEMSYYGLTGHSLTGRILGNELVGEQASGNSSLAPSYPNDVPGRAPQMPTDDVEEASMESFPASDPPASTQSELPK